MLVLGEEQKRVQVRPPQQSLLRKQTGKGEEGRGLLGGCDCVSWKTGKGEEI